ncbi:CRISPR-associated protein Cas5d [Ruminococcus flavefaciens]|uniref:pre-crRNA processing endonuclease n=1 Tax=Ruminococcus flavefaciens TaxID=1265 RepID=A0A1H6HQZ7_RUMFL|nr:type I-C CRISPR-associated protein Cas5c [Ruminococcus flavefaciens]SEH38348.1 CRISPR-associated protein Cas5d [Ruminococcus flavefaciens]
MGYGFKIIVEGDYALFTRPEFKVERVSYDVPTISAIEGLIKSVYWKPAIRIIVDKIIVFNPIRFINIRRNEIKCKIPLSSVKSQMKGKGSAEIYASEQRSQRAGMLLRDVKYGIEFHFELTGNRSEHEDECEEKHYNIMLRRLRNGQFFRQPCLGCREFSVKRMELVDDFDMSLIDSELEGDIDLGFMLYGLKFDDGGKPVNDDWENPRFSDIASPLYYRPHMINGVIDVDKYREGIVC